MKPEIVVFAGPNGSGKSTFTELLKPVMDYINADEIGKYLQIDNMEAAMIAEEQRNKHVDEGKSFSFETVLSTDRNIKLLKRAKEKGFFIRCYYVLTADPIVNVFRIKTRVATGGHDVPEEKIIARYYRALALVKDLLEICDICHIYDNSEATPFRIFKQRKNEYFYDECVDWTLEDIKALTGVKTAIKFDLNDPVRKERQKAELREKREAREAQKTK